MTRPEPAPAAVPLPERFGTETEWLLAELRRQQANAAVAEAVRAGTWPVAPPGPLVSEGEQWR